MKKQITIVAAIMLIIFVQATVVDNQLTTKAQLGALLFSDPILSKDSTVSCSSCHRPEHAFADTSAVSIGVGGKKVFATHLQL